MLNRLPVGFALAISLAVAAVSPAADAPDYSKEAAVIQDMTTKVSFSANGAREWRQTLSVRVQSEAAVRQLGVLGFLYNSDNEQLEIEYVRVRKAGGSVVETPNSSALDVATEVATTAPTYSDLRQKQIPVKALGVGDVLEYSVRSWQRKPEVPGQFWYQQILIDDAVVLNQSLEIRVPKDKYVQVSSPKLKSETREEGDQRVYVWKHSHLEPSKPDDKKKQFISGSDFLKNAAHAIQTAKYDFAFPDEGPEKIIRRGILSCSNFTKPSCQLTLLLPSTVRKDSKPN